MRYDIKDLLGGLDNVEVLLVPGDWSLIGKPLWTMVSLKTVLRCENGGSSSKAGRSKRRRRMSNVPDGWKVGGRRILHQVNGGVCEYWGVSTV